MPPITTSLFAHHLLRQHRSTPDGRPLRWWALQPNRRSQHETDSVATVRFVEEHGSDRDATTGLANVISRRGRTDFVDQP